MKNEKDWDITLKAIYEKQTSIIGLKLWECLATYFIVSFNCLNTISLWHKMDINYIHHSANKICLSVRLFQKLTFVASLQSSAIQDGKAKEDHYLLKLSYFSCLEFSH